MVILVKEEVTFLTTPGSRFIGHFTLEWRGHFHWNMQIDAILHIKWDTASTSIFNSDDDQATIIAYNPAKQVFVSFEGVAQRGDKEVSLQLTSDFTGETVQCWQHFVNAQGNVASTTVYLGEVMVG